MDPTTERVLVLPTARFHEAGPFQGFTPEVARYLPHLLDPAHLSYRPRAEVETDPSFKQLIPYVVLRWRDQVFHYTRGRKAAETRLHALRSVGVGGHINDTDRVTTGDPYRAGLLREIAEEVDLQSDYEECCLGLINDDSNPVGQVHLGVVHVLDLADPRVRPREQGFAESGFAPIRDLQRRLGEFETWSRIVLAHLAG
jgi:predicted NUDIX family phosphoesterase